MRVSAQGVQAEQAHRYVPDMDPMVKEASDAHRVYIFNVGPWPHMRALGSSGRYLIPACPEGKEYSEPLVIQGIESEPYPLNETECVMIPKAGRPLQLRGDGQGAILAMQILGEGPMRNRHESIRPFGVFISKTPIPSASDLKDARAALQMRRTELVAEANETWTNDRAHAKDYILTEWHARAARDLGKTVTECPWLGVEQVGAERKKCDSCGTPYEVGIAECPKCGNPLDEDKYREKMERIARLSKPKKAA